MPASARKALAGLAALPALKTFYLAGGTALALYWGHRTSVDLDFFSHDRVDEDVLLGRLNALPGITIIQKAPDVLSQHYGLDELFSVFKQKFGAADFNLIHVLKSLTYFMDADPEPLPHMLQPIRWNQVRQFFVREVPRLKKLI